MPAFAGNKASVKIGAVTLTTSTNQACTLTTATKTLRLNTAARRAMDPDSWPTYPKVFAPASTSVAVTADKYTVNFANGSITFTTARAAGTYTMDIRWVTPAAVANANSWTVTVQQDLLPDSVFGSTWQTNQLGLRGAGITIGGFYDLQNNSTLAHFFDYLDTEERVYVELFPSSTLADKYVAWGWIANNQVGAQVGALETESVDIAVDGPLTYTTST